MIVAERDLFRAESHIVTGGEDFRCLQTPPLLLGNYCFNLLAQIFVLLDVFLDRLPQQIAGVPITNNLLPLVAVSQSRNDVVGVLVKQLRSPSDARINRASKTVGVVRLNEGGVVFGNHGADALLGCRFYPRPLFLLSVADYF